MGFNMVFCFLSSQEFVPHGRSNQSGTDIAWETESSSDRSSIRAPGILTNPLTFLWVASRVPDSISLVKDLDSSSVFRACPACDISGFWRSGLILPPIRMGTSFLYYLNIYIYIYIYIHLLQYNYIDKAFPFASFQCAGKRTAFWTGRLHHFRQSLMRKNYADNFYLNKLYSKFFFIGNSPVISDRPFDWIWSEKDNSTPVERNDLKWSMDHLFMLLLYITCSESPALRRWQLLKTEISDEYVQSRDSRNIPSSVVRHLHCSDIKSLHKRLHPDVKILLWRLFWQS